MARKDFTRTEGQSGFTLVELMIALVLGLLVVLAATAMLLATRSTYGTQDESTRLQESARFSLDLTNRVVRLAGYTNFGNGSTDIPPSYAPGVSANISGVNGTLPAGDSLTISYFGSGTTYLGSGASSAVADGSVLDCKGAAVDNGRAVNIFFVAPGTDGEPELFCDDRGPNAPLSNSPQSLIRGVESFQVLYGVPAYPAGTPADDVDFTAPATIAYKRADQMVVANSWGSDWDHVLNVRIAMLLRSATGARADLDTTNYQLFGPNYAAGADAGAALNTATMSNLERSRLRRVVSSTIAIRNRVSQWPTLVGS